MNDFDKKNKIDKTIDPFGHKKLPAMDPTEFDDEIDKELLALSAPAPNFKQALVILVVLGFSIFILVLFFPELKYLLKSFDESTPLGEAANIDISKVSKNSFVSIEGLPLVNQTLTFSTGAKWFSSDRYRKMAPLSGQPNVLVQWSTHNPDIKQAKSSISPPSYFEGKLEKRENMGQNYNKFWPFYDCLQLHNTSRCKFCISRGSLKECRKVFSCVEHYPRKLCGEIISRSSGPLMEEISDLEEKISSGQAPSKAEQKLEELNQIKAALQEEDIEVALIQLDEFQSRAKFIEKALKDNNKDERSILLYRTKILNHQIAELNIRAALQLDKINGMGEKSQTQLSNSYKELLLAKENETKLNKHYQKLDAFHQVYTELKKFVIWTTQLQQKTFASKPEKQDQLIKWVSSVNAQTRNGAEILLAVSTLGSVFNIKTATIEQELQNQENSNTGNNFSDAGLTDAGLTDAGLTDAGLTDAGLTDAKPKEIIIPPLEEIQNPAIKDVISILETFKNRVNKLKNKVKKLGIDDNSQFTNWATRTDLVGSIPEALRASDVFNHLTKTENLLVNFVASPNSLSINKRIRAAFDELKKNTETQEHIKSISGISEIEIIAPLKKLNAALSKTPTKTWLEQTSSDYINLKSTMMLKEFYPNNLSNYPREIKAMAKLVDSFDIATLDHEIAVFEEKYPHPTWVLLDKENPSDNPWILFVYIILPIMIIINIRKLLQFWRIWRS